MDSNRSGRRRFLKQAAALAGLAAGAEPSASGHQADPKHNPKTSTFTASPKYVHLSPGGRAVPRNPARYKSRTPCSSARILNAK